MVDFIDITWGVDENVIHYSHLEGYRLNWVKKIENGDDCNMTSFSLDSHVGTHMDAPLHYVKDGKAINDIPLSRFFCRAQVLECEHTVDLDFIQSRLDKTCTAFLFKFGLNRLDCQEPYFAVEAIKYMYDHGAEIIGTDNYAVDSGWTGKRIHLFILPLEISILEVLKLDGVEEGVYEMVALPMKIDNAEASSSRVVLMKEGSFEHLFD